MASSGGGKSNFVTVTAWIFIVLAGFTTFISLLQNVMLHTVFPLDQMRAQMAGAPETQQIPAVFRFMFANFEWLFALFFLISLITVIAAVGLLKRRNWARLLFVGIMVLGAVWNLVGTVVQPILMSQMPVPPNAPSEFQSQFQSIKVVMLGFSLVFGLGFAALFGWVAWRLRSSEIAAEFQPSNVPG